MSHRSATDFLSELGLEGGEEEESAWDSESGSDSPGKQHGVPQSPVKTHRVMASISEENTEGHHGNLTHCRNYEHAGHHGNLTHCRNYEHAGHHGNLTHCRNYEHAGHHGNLMLTINPLCAGLAHTRPHVLHFHYMFTCMEGGVFCLALVMHQHVSMATTLQSRTFPCPNAHYSKEDSLDKKSVWKAEPASSSPKPAEKPKEEAIKKTDLMEELGLGDADDLEGSVLFTLVHLAPCSQFQICGSHSIELMDVTASRTAPRPKLALPMEEELRDSSPVPAQSPAALGKDTPTPPAQTPPLPSPRSSTSRSAFQPLPHPRARKPQPVRAESEEESDWDSESVTPASSPGKTVKPKPSIPEKKAISKPDGPARPPDLSPEDGGSEGNTESVEEPPK
ncbi:hypothetical protein JZ751_015394, partial [Albula glossodonta]